MSTSSAARQTQGERSARTQRRILDAALECLATHGYAGTTTTNVAERAGVSRGAQLHHYRTRAELVSAALQHLFAGLRDDYGRAFWRRASGRDRIGVAIDLLWQTFQDDRLTAVLELFVAGRTDPELLAELAPVAARHQEHIVHLAREIFPETARMNGRLEPVLGVVLSAMQGLAVRRLVEPEDGAVAETLAELKRFASSALGLREAKRNRE